MADRFDPRTASCVPMEEIAAVLGRENDPRRLHVTECPRCGALARELTSFLAEPETVDVAAVARLESRLSKEILGPPARHGGAVIGWFGVSWKPALAIAASVLVIFIASNLRQDRPTDESPLLRGASPAGATFRGETRAAFEAGAEGGVIVFRWEEQDGADTYRVELFDDALVPVRTLAVGRETTLRWTPDLETFRSRTWLWRVVALEQGDPIRRSAFHTLEGSVGKDPER